MRRSLIPLVVAVGLVGLSLSASAEFEEESDPWALEFDQRAADIRAEIEAGSKAAWAGEYGFGDGLGVNVRLALAPDRGFAISWSGCLGVYGRNYGFVQVRNDRLVLDFVHPNETGEFGNFSKVLIPVQWGERHYLVGEEQLGEFANAVNEGLEPCSGWCSRFLIRAGDEDLEVTGKPTLPGQYSASLRGEPMHARVLRIIEPDLDIIDGESRWRRATVELDVGHSGGTWTGMEFYSTTGGIMGEIFTVERVDESTSVATVISYESRPLVPRSGTCVSTFVDDLVETREQARPSGGCEVMPVAGR